MDWPQAISYAAPATAVAGIAIHAAVKLSGAYVALRLKAADQQRGVPPLVSAYFSNTVRVLFGSAALFFGAAIADAILSFAAPAPVLARAFGYGGALCLLVCGFALLLQGGVDRHLKLLGGLRWLHMGAGMAGIGAAAWGMTVVTRHGGVWV